MYGYNFLCLVIFSNISVMLCRPNVLFIAVDDLRPTLSCYGYKNILTPNIDQLASQSVLFNQTFVQQALCGPSRTSFLTSRRPDTTRLYDFYSYWRDTVGNFTTLPQHFKENGYHTVSIGKIFHHGKCSGKYQDYPYSWSEIPYIPSTMKYKMKKVCPGTDSRRHMNVVCPVDVPSQPEKTLPDIQNYQHAVDFLKQKKLSDDQKPFFLGVGFYKPHIPLKYPKEFLDFYPIESIYIARDPNIPPTLPSVAWNPWADIRRRDDVKHLNISFPYGSVPKDFQKLMRQSYYAATTFMDYCVGKVLSALDQYGYRNNTIIVFVGDHGWSLGEHQEWSKFSNYEVAVRVPFLLSVPGLLCRIPSFEFINVFANTGLVLDDPMTYNRKYSDKRDKILFNKVKIKSKNRLQYIISNKLVELVDIFPTLAELANLTVPGTCSRDSIQNVFCTEGTSLVPILYNRDHQLKWKNASFSQFPRPSVFPQYNSDQPRLKNIKIMGYTMRTNKYRYTEWIAFDNVKFIGNWSRVFGRELYVHDDDPFEDYNVAYNSKFRYLVLELSDLLRKGWRNALP